MSGQTKRSGLWLAASLVVIVLAAVVVWRAVFFKPGAQIQTAHRFDPLPLEPFVPDTNEPVNTPTEGNADPRPTLNDVIRAARTWQPVYRSWFGRTAPDFTLTDLNGKQHKLSDYRGKNVMLVFWAAWCGPCVMEVPHLTALQNIVGKDDLAILAISYLSPRNTTEMVRRFVRQNDRISYTVFSVSPDSMPEPFDGIVYIPCSFFVQPDGKIKLATTGLLTLADMKAILQAE